MANAIDKVNGIAIASIEAINGITDANLQALNGLEFTGVLPESHTLIATATASSSATLEFTSGIDSTYDAYEFRFTNMHPASDGVRIAFQVNASDDTGGGFDTSLFTSTAISAYHSEADGTPALNYAGAQDQAQGAGYQLLSTECGFDNDQAVSGVLTLYDPSSTTFVKHFTSTVQGIEASDLSQVYYMAGYINQTLAIPEISFKFSSGNIDAGVIKMYGIAKS